MPWKEAAALSPADKIERTRAKWRLTAKRKDRLPEGRARKRRVASRKAKDARLALRACKTLFGPDWRARVALVLPQ